MQNTSSQYRHVSICGRNCMCRLRVVIEFAKDVKYTHPIQTSVDLRQKLHVSTQGCHRICKRCRIQAPNTDTCRFAAETACVDLGLSQNLQKIRNTRTQYRLVSICGRNCMCRLLRQKLHVSTFAAETARVDFCGRNCTCRLLRQKLHVSTFAAETARVDFCGRNCTCRLLRQKLHVSTFAAETARVDFCGRNCTCRLLRQKLHVSTFAAETARVDFCGRNCTCRLLRQKLHVSTFAAETARVDFCGRNCTCRLLRQKLHVSTFAAETACVDFCGRNCMCRLRVVIEFAKDVKYTHPIQTSVDLRQKLHVSTQGSDRICKRCRIEAPNTDTCPKSTHAVSAANRHQSVLGACILHLLQIL